jgi:hypothetical protein
VTLFVSKAAVLTPTTTAMTMPAVTPTPSPTPTAIKSIVLQPSPLSSTGATIPETPPRWPFLLIGLMVLTCGTAVLYWRRQHNRLWVSGTVRLLDGQLAAGSTLIDLDDLRREVVTIGPPPADVPLPDAIAQIAIRPVISMDDICDYIVTPLSGNITLDGLPLTRDTRLTDTAVLDLGGVRMRYENLWLRQAEREREMHLEMNR